MLPEPLPVCLGLGVLTVAAYAACYALAQRVRHPILNPVLLSAGLTIVVLLALGKDFEAYRPVRDVLTAPLGAATAALAVPVYNQRARLRVLDPVARGVAIGTTSHAIGTAAALLEGETSGAMSSLAMVGAAAATAALAPAYVTFVLRLFGYAS